MVESVSALAPSNVYTLLFRSTELPSHCYFTYLFGLVVFVCLFVMQTIAAQLSDEHSAAKRGEAIKEIIGRIGIVFSQ
jgi:hypothetical protein